MYYIHDLITEQEYTGDMLLSQYQGQVQKCRYILSVYMSFFSCLGWQTGPEPEIWLAHCSCIHRHTETDYLTETTDEDESATCYDSRCSLNV